MIISCSRRTDIPAFYSDWFFNRISDGFVQVRNPVNHRQVKTVSLAPNQVDCIVFWTKNPAHMLDRLQLLKDYNFYFQFTLTPYANDIEPNLPPKKEIIDSFRKLSGEIGKERMIWRYDPILLSKGMDIKYHVEQFRTLAKQLTKYTEKCIISFLDLYQHLQAEMTRVSIRPPDVTEMLNLAREIVKIAGNYNIKVETCAEAVDLADLGIGHGKCIDDRLIAQLTGLNLKVAKDKHQRELCGCVESCDIGEYNTCSHLCKYCYANFSQKKLKNISRHSDQSSLLTFSIKD